jgi:hypothetical protein
LSYSLSTCDFSSPVIIQIILKQNNTSLIK